MKLTIRLFARARDLAGADSISFDLPAGGTVRDLKSRLAAERPALAGMLERSALAVDNELADDGLVLQAGAEIALLPPVSGGCGASRRT
jgi:molybdopterin converting factor subunit 1